MDKVTRCMMTISPISITGAEIDKLIGLQNKPRDIFSLLPEYCLNREGHITETDYYYQFMFTFPNNSAEEIFHLFDVEFTEQPLQEEISNSGIFDILKNIDLRPVFEKLTIPEFETKHHYLTNTWVSHLVFNATYVNLGRGYEDLYNEYDFEVELYGYLDTMRELIPIKNNQ